MFDKLDGYTVIRHWLVQEFGSDTTSMSYFPSNMVPSIYGDQLVV